MSPEQVKGQGSVDHRADLWALGCMAFECLIGRPVWNTDQGVAMTFAAIAAANIPIPSKQRADLPPGFDQWFLKALERDPNRRYQTAKELADALARSFGGEQSVSAVNLSGENNARAAVAMAEHLSDDDDEQAMGTRVRRSVDRSAPTIQTTSQPRTTGPSNPSALNTSPSGHLFPQPSFGDAPPLSSTPATEQVPAAPTGPPPKFRSNTVRYIVSTTGLLIGVSASYLAWTQCLRPQVYTPLVQSSASIPATASPSASAGEPPVPDGEPRWAAAIEEGQRLFTVGNAADARKKFSEAIDEGANAVGRSFLEELRVPQSGPCKLTAFSHPRLGISGSVGRPAIANGGKGAVVVWTDEHEQPGHEHAYSVVIDGTGRPLSRPRDLTPEGNEISRPSLLEAGERTLLYYWDNKGREAGIHARWLDADGRIAGASVLIGAGKPGNYWPSLERAPDGYYASWVDDRGRDGADLWLRHLNSDLQPMAPEIRATDYWGGPKVRQQPQVRVPSIALASNAIYVTYKLEREPQHMIMLMRIPLTLPSLQTGLDDKPGPLLVDGGRGDRELGDAEIVNEDRANADAPAIACGTEGCFVVWHGDSGGGYAALIEPVLGRVLWRKKFAPLGGHPSLATSGDKVEVAYYEKGFVRIAQLTRDGVGTPSTIGRVSNEQPRPWISSGAQKGEWLVAWEDTEAGHLEAFAARVQCR
jgi:serine/threonine-protein kinase